MPNPGNLPTGPLAAGGFSWAEISAFAAGCSWDLAANNTVVALPTIKSAASAITAAANLLRLMGPLPD